MNLNFNLNKIKSLISKNADLIGLTAGTLSRGYPIVLDNLEKLLTGEGHMPDIKVLIREYMAWEPVKEMAMGYVGCEILKQFGIKEGAIGQKLIKAYAIGLFVQDALYHSVHSGSIGGGGGGGHSSGGKSETWRYQG